MSLSVLKASILDVPADALVNAANEALLAGGGVCGAIFSAAGYEALQNACHAIGSCPTGHAVLTEGFGLAPKKIIHTVGPVYRDGAHGEEAALREAYRSALQIAVDNHLRRIAFPLISAGIYGYPKHAALKVAVSEMNIFLKQNNMEDTLTVLLCLPDTAPFDKTLDELGYSPVI